MWPREVAWETLRFGVEIEFVGADPSAVGLLPGWTMDTDESQRAMSGDYSGAEVKPTKLAWEDRAQIGETFEALRAAGGDVNWSCGLHVHVGLEPWGADILLPLIDAALHTQAALRELFATPADRLLFAPAVTQAQRDAWVATPGEDALRHVGRPQSSRSGVNVAAWYDFGTVEIRYPNATLDPDAACRTVEACLRWVAAVGAGRSLPSDAAGLAAALGVPATGYPPPHPQPVWHAREEQWTELLFPILQPLVEAEVPGAEILFVRPTPEGIYVKTDLGDRKNHRFMFRADVDGFSLMWMQAVEDGAPSPLLQDGDLRLRPLRPAEDIDVALPWYADPEVLRWSEGGAQAPYSPATITRMYETLATQGDVFIIEVAAAPGWKPIGDVTLGRDGIPITIGDPDYRSRGFGTRTLALLVARARALGWPELVTNPIQLANERSLRMFARAGFVRDQPGRDDRGNETVVMRKVL